MPKDHLLTAAARVWADIKGELDDKDCDADRLSDSAAVPPEELRKVAKYYVHTVTKFGASASVAADMTGPQQDSALKPIAEEVIKAFTAVVGTLLSLRRGAGHCLRKELRDVAGGLAEATERLGGAVGTPNVANAAGKCLDRAKDVERISVHNRAATRRQILKSLAHLRDVHREISEALKKEPAAESDDEDDELELDDFDAEELEPHERAIAEALANVAQNIESYLEKASQACMPTSPTGADPPSMGELEMVATTSRKASSAVDVLVTSAMGGVDREACNKSLDDLAAAIVPCDGSFAPGAGDELRAAVEAVRAALAGAPDDA